ncbi:DUF6701 domain-containing protein [Photobacterium sp. J15]|uniref:DUF6701 domain-containing protein n=1 Tax=Photobacterium sp. J15 TaxID=265901 RepID=UPI0007E49319|nr:DUF6701 domain-containing protein [Photobacterium sp. J15]
MTKNKKCFPGYALWFACLLAFASMPVVAKTYNLDNSRKYPPCSDGRWNKNGSTFTCNGKMELKSGDKIRSNHEYTLLANEGIKLNNNQVGSAANSIHLKTHNGKIEVKNSNHVYSKLATVSGGVDIENSTIIGLIDVGGDIDIKKTSVSESIVSRDGSISLTERSSTGGEIRGSAEVEVKDSSVSGDVVSEHNKVTIDDSTISGAVTGSAEVKIEESSITQSVESQNNKVEVESSDISGSVTAEGEVKIEGDQVTGDITSRSSKITIEDTSVIGSLSSGGEVKIEDSDIIGDITSSWGKVELEDSTIKGNVDAADHQVVEVKEDSKVFGYCRPRSEPENACAPLPVLAWSMDESSWTNGSNRVEDSSGSNLHGTAYNNSNTAGDAPALPIDSSFTGTCNYGEFSSSQRQYVEVTHDDKLSFDDNFTISAWVKPTAYPHLGSLRTVISKDTNYEININPDGKLSWWWEQQGNRQSHTLVSRSDIPLNKWTHITVRYKRARGWDKTSQWIFINGRLDNTARIKFKAARNTLPFQVGQDHGYATHYFDGNVDEVKVFNTALNDEQIAELARERHLCESAADDPGFRYGRVVTAVKATTVVFEKPFPLGKTPLVFLAPTINASTPDQDGPSTLRLTNITNVGFTVEQKEPYAPPSHKTPSQLMSNIDYVAVLPGKTTLSNNHELYAGTVMLRNSTEDKVLQGARNGSPKEQRGWRTVDFPSGQFSQKPTLMLELQSQGNARWLTVAGNEVTQNGFKVALEQSEVRGGNADLPETIAYLATLPGTGEFELFGRTVGYDFQHARSGFIEQAQNFKVRCEETTDFKYTKFTTAPVMVVGKLSRTGSNGGWIRRCHRDSKRMSIVMDEDQDFDEERSHKPEDVSYMAFSIDSNEKQPSFEFGPYPNSALTCTPVSFTVNVVDEDNNPITDYVGQIGLATTTGNGDWVLETGNGSFVSGNVDSGNASYQFVEQDQGSATFTLSYLHVGNVAVILSNSSGEELNRTNEVTFKAEGLKLVRKGSFPYGRKSAIANKPITYQLSAVTEDPTAKGQCKPIEAFANEKDITFRFDYQNPSTGNVIPTINGNNLKLSADTTLAMTFTKGVADFAFNYADAGAIQLTVKQAEDVVEPDDPSKNWLAQHVINVSPWLVVTNVAGNKYGTAADTDKAFKAAGSPFNVTYKAVKWERSKSDSSGLPTSDPTHIVVTPGFKGTFSAAAKAQNITPGSGVAGTLVFPGSLSYSSGQSPTAVQASYGEVGSFKLGGIAANNYLISGNSVPFYTYGNIGRFYPKNLSVSAMKPINSCSVFNYFGNNNSTIGFTLTAKNEQGQTTKNYDFMKGYKAVAVDKDFNLNGEDSDDGNALKDQIKRSSSAFSWAQGVMTTSWYYQVIKHAAPHIPYNSFVLSLEGKGPDNVPLSPLNENPGEPGGSAHSATKLAGDLIFRWGRVRLTDAYGPEIAPISAPFFVEYYASPDSFVISEDDQCTNIALSDFIFKEGTDKSALPVGKGTTKVTFDALTSGEGALNFTAPGSGNQGVLTPELDLNKAGYPWLRVDQTGNGVFDDNEKAQIQFGLYRGSDRIIWWREKNN